MEEELGEKTRIRSKWELVDYGNGSSDDDKEEEEEEDTDKTQLVWTRLCACECDIV